mmetsp:Transcript_5034/g.12885  ORF Transcript_5034/g.12885 Transcript_5034/m.12885 type:complete len:288 (+) Transcript_5034:778-1641(+)
MSWLARAPPSPPWQPAPSSPPPSRPPSSRGKLRRRQAAPGPAGRPASRPQWTGAPMLQALPGTAASGTRQAAKGSRQACRRAYHRACHQRPRPSASSSAPSSHWQLSAALRPAPRGPARRSCCPQTPGPGQRPPRCTGASPTWLAQRSSRAGGSGTAASAGTCPAGTGAAAVAHRQVPAEWQPSPLAPAQLGRLTPPSRTLWRGCGSFSAGEERGVRWLGAALPRASGLSGRDAARSCCCGGTALGRPSLSRQCTNNVGRAVGTGGRRSGGYQGPGRFPLQKWVRLE